MGLMKEIIVENHRPRKALLVSIRKSNKRVGGAPIAEQISKTKLQAAAEIARQSDSAPLGADFSFRQGLDRLVRTD